jgi:hypothetical protein
MTLDDGKDEYDVPTYVYGDWAVHADLRDDDGWCIMPLLGGLKLSAYVFDTALEAAQFASMLNGFNVDWESLQHGDTLRIAEILTPLYRERYREYNPVKSA